MGNLLGNKRFVLDFSSSDPVVSTTTFDRLKRRLRETKRKQEGQNGAHKKSCFWLFVMLFTINVNRFVFAMAIKNGSGNGRPSLTKRVVLG